MSGADDVSAARVTVRAWTLGLRAAFGELAAAKLRWCLGCGRVGLWGWQPLTPSMPITWICVDRLACRRRQAVAWARWERSGATPGRSPMTARAGPVGDPGRPRHPGWGRPAWLACPATGGARPQPFPKQVPRRQW